MTFLDKLPKPFFALAPMDDVTDTVFRQIIADLAKPDLFFTEFVNVDGLQSPGRVKLIHKLLLTDKEKPVIAQIWGLKPDNYYKTTKDLIKMGFAGVDINMGCPVKTVVKNGACAALINNKELAGDIIDAVKEAAGPFPVSVKTRVGFTTVDLSWLEHLLNKKLDLLSIHTRTAAQMSKVPAEWSLLDPIREMRGSLSPQTLLVGNGDVETLQEAEELAKKHKLDGIMIGRGIFNDPLIFSNASPWKDWTAQMKIDLFKKHIELHIQTYKDGERRFETLRKFCKVYINGFDGAADLRAKFMETSNPDQALTLLNRVQDL
jgi:tRNA-dihydrouridine synthase